MTILASLARAYERLADRQKVPPFGYSVAPISFLISLKSDGSPACSPIDLRTGAGRERQAASMMVPAAFKRSGTAPRPYFLWDNSAFALGVTATEGKAAKARFDSFRVHHERVLSSSEDEGLRAFLYFLQTWQPDSFAQFGWPEEMKDRNIVFALEAERLQNIRIHDRPVARTLHAELLSTGKSNDGICLVTGEKGPIARIHPPIRGIRRPKALKDSDSLVSFNLDAFTSYHHEKGENAPICEAAAFAYTTALNHFLERNSRHRIQIGDAATMFWADTAGADAVIANEVEEVFRALLAEGRSDEEAHRDAEIMASGSRVDEAGETGKVGAVLAQIRAGRPGELRLGLQEQVRFHVLGLSPSATRLSVRFWLDDEFGELARRYAAHVGRMRIEPPPKDESPSIWRCLIETATLRKTENIPPNLAGEWLRAILTGRPYPLTLLTTLLMRMRADKDVNALRVAMLKAVLMRNFGLTEKEVPVGLDPGNKERGYLLGRLFATFERVQTDALPGVKATIRDKFYGAASATPRKIFTVLDRGSANHLSKLSKDNKGRAVNLEKLIASIMAELTPDGDPFPTFLSSEQQALFPLGYYHQKSEFFRRQEAGSPIAAPQEPTT